MSGERERRRGMLLIDIMITLAVLGIVLLAVLPSTRPEEHVKLVGVASMLAADVEYAQSATLADPGEPTVVVFRADGTGYRLASASDPATAIDRPGDDDPWEVTFGEGELRPFGGVTIRATDIEGDVLEFDGFGRLTQELDGVVRVSGAAGGLRVTVRADTGTVAIGE